MSTWIALIRSRPQPSHIPHDLARDPICEMYRLYHRSNTSIGWTEPLPLYLLLPLYSLSHRKKQATRTLIYLLNMRTMSTIKNPSYVRAVEDVGVTSAPNLRTVYPQSGSGNANAAAKKLLSTVLVCAVSVVFFIIFSKMMKETLNVPRRTILVHVALGPNVVNDGLV